MEPPLAVRELLAGGRMPPLRNKIRNMDMSVYTKITAIIPGSPSSRTIITVGDVLRKINGNVITDVLDYEYHSYNNNLLLELTDGSNGKIKLIRLKKPEGQGLGLEFENFLMDAERSCRNKCIFCFIDQLPKGMRKTLYYKDDDVRLSFLHGNYVTLTNLTDKDIERIIRLRISPINISIHTLNPELRQFMLGHKNRVIVERTHKYIERLACAGITLNCQIVCCPGTNDGSELRRTIRGLIEMGEGINSVSVVPVGLTKHREGLHSLQPFTKKLAIKTIGIVDYYGEKCLKQRGSRVFYCGDELYIIAEKSLPPNSYYEDYPQLENGVGMMRLFITEFLQAAKAYKKRFEKNKRGLAEESAITIVTGTLAAPYLTNLLQILKRDYGRINCKVQAIRNEFFGESVTVSGLVTGHDIINQLHGKSLGEKVLIPQNMLRSGEDVFLDDVTVTDISRKLGVQVKIIGQNGKEFFEALME